MAAEYLQGNQPDILEVIANLSNDAVFTPPRVANAVLDLLPSNVWTDPTLRWLDPGAKTGVFPREIAKRLMVGLADVIPDENGRLRHILTEMIFAIATEEITAMMTRRSLYCSKDATSDFSAVRFDSKDGNVWHGRVEHQFSDRGPCEECGGTRELESGITSNKAYALVHKDGRQKIEKEMNMKFDVIIGNPPYQMDSDAEGKNVSSLYDAFVLAAMKLSPRYLAMIIPSRWMAGGRGLEEFRSAMLNDTRIRNLVDYPNAGELFPGVEIKGGVCYFLWDRDHAGLCSTSIRRDNVIIGPIERSLNEFETFVRDPRAVPILEKVLKFGEPPFADIVSTRDPFGPTLSSNFAGFRKSDEKTNGDLKLHMVIGGKRVVKWVDPDKVTRNHSLIRDWKVFVPKAYGASESIPHQVIGQCEIGVPNSVCSPTYLVVGPLSSKEEAESVDSYLRTRFARFLISLSKISQNSTQKNYAWVPLQTWDRTWTDVELYKKYGIAQAEQEYIESMVKEMTS